MIKILIVEDEAETVEPVQRKIEQDDNVDCEIVGFGDAKEHIRTERPDIVILDLLAGGASGEPEVAGQETYNYIWDERFCPIIIYSAQPDAEAEKRDSHPFVISIQKGTGSPDKVIKAINSFKIHIEAIKSAEESISKSFSASLKYVAPHAFEIYSSEPEKCKEIILKSGRRRLAALMDDIETMGECLAGWEQYISPPISDDIKMGDILRLSEGQPDEPSAFYIVLTPSCDLVASGGRSPRVNQVLVANCIDINDAFGRLQMVLKKSEYGDSGKVNELKKQIRTTVLTQGYHKNFIPLPSFKGKIPAMVANIKNLELIPLTDVGISEKKYLRIASLDSPFKELISWAYLNTACRPGLPERHFDSWVDEIVDILSSS